MDFSISSRKDIGNHGESVAVEYLRRLGFRILGRNIAFKTGELDIVAQKGSVVHIVEVKTLLCQDFPDARRSQDRYDPADNLSIHKLRKVTRTAEWYLAQKGWEGEWQIDGALVWLRAHDGVARVRYLPQVG
ncbi:MAG: putative endonuclease distantly related to archaeal Holliday junction resolvase [Parcubacteria group bacterium]|nr:putative endonuclease distantly related to archaeal Holliday junction resolvase [Parcubacteria group bacterium]